MNKTIKQISFTLILAGVLQTYLSAQEDLDQALVHQVTKTRTDINGLFDGKDLVSIPYSTSIVRYRDENWALGFILDSGWNRILYGKVYLGGLYPIKWTKATGPTGSGWNDVLLDNPEGIATDIPDVDDTPHERDVYVADTGNRRVVKLHYDPSVEVEDFVSVDYFTGFNRPSDVDIDNRGTVLDPSDDIIWVADRSDNAVVAISPQGSQLAFLTSYLQLDGTERSFYRPDRLTIGQHPSIWGGDENRLYILETSVTNKLIGLEIQTDLSLKEVFTYQFPDGVFPTDMDTDDRGDLWISAGNEGNLYRILRSGEMLGTFGSPGTGDNQFDYPMSVSNFIGKDHMIITEHYTSSSGGKVFQAGADVLNMSVTQMPETFDATVQYTLTNWCDVTTNILRSSGELVETIVNDQTLSSGLQTHEITLLGPGQYTLEVRADPLHTTIPDPIHTFDFTIEMPSEVSGVIEITEDLTIPAQSTLTILPGSELLFGDGVTLYIEGTLQVSGEDDNPVKLTSIALANWGGIVIQPGGTIEIEHAVIENAYMGVSFFWNYWSGIQSQASQITNTVFQNNSVNILYYYWFSEPALVAPLTIDKCTFSDNMIFILGTNHPITVTNCVFDNSWISTNEVYGELTIQDNTFLNNGTTSVQNVC